MTDKKYKCEDCSKELPHSVIVLQQMINASYDLKVQNNKLLERGKMLELALHGVVIQHEDYYEKYNKLLEFVKNQAALHESQEKLLMLADAGYRVEHVLEARELLKELGEDK